ncbi:MAG: DUF1295 domain-containing protein [Candidatus Hodarchaeota archaeon]
MSKKDIQSLIAIIIILFIATCLALAGSQGSVIILGGIPLFAFGVAIAFIIQWIAFIPAYIKRTEMFFDLTGSLSYIIITILSIVLSPEVDTRSILLMILVSIWTIRLGAFLFSRILKEGEDKRFKHIKQSFSRFLLAWTLQGLWVCFTLSTALAAITGEQKKEFGIIGLIGLLIWIIGFGFEVLADYQKRKFRSVPENKGKFINSGLWSLSRHPNYFGEILLWIGIAIIALPTLQGWRWLTLISPVFVTLLLTKISGIPLLEKHANEKWGGQEDYEEYKNSTPVLIPKIIKVRYK